MSNKMAEIELSVSQNAHLASKLSEFSSQLEAVRGNVQDEAEVMKIVFDQVKVYISV